MAEIFTFSLTTLIIQQETGRFSMHTLARQPFYDTLDGHKIRRYPVPNARVPFLTAYESYQPTYYSAPSCTDRLFIL